MAFGRERKSASFLFCSFAEFGEGLDPSRVLDVFQTAAIGRFCVLRRPLDGGGGTGRLATALGGQGPTVAGEAVLKQLASDVIPSILRRSLR